MPVIQYPSWAEEMRQIFRSETVSQYILYGNINDFVMHKDDDKTSVFTLKEYLFTVMFAQFDVILGYDRGQGIQVLKGETHFYDYLRVIDQYHGTKFTAIPSPDGDIKKALSRTNLLPGNPLAALELIERFVNGTLNKGAARIGSVAFIIDYAHLIAPKGESVYMSGDIGSQMIKLLNWAEDTSVKGFVSCLLTENLLDLNDLISGSSYNAKLRINYPDKQEIEDYITDVIKNELAFSSICQLPVSTLAEKMIGMNRVNIRSLIMRALRNSISLSIDYLTKAKKETIEKEAMGKLEYLETSRNLDHVAGHVEAKKWLRDDSDLIRRGITNAIPMGYLFTGRIGTGKTYLVQCFAGECGVPFVELKNFRDKWVGATEGNLEKIFSILHALGQVVVFVDEADQATGKRGGGDESGISGRIYAMLAKEMSNTANRGKIIWIFATSRPDMVEVDLKRQGRLDVHIPLFPPVDKEERRELFYSMAKKLKVDIKKEELPELPFDGAVGGNELEGLLVRAIRKHALQQAETKKSLTEILAETAKDFRPSAHTKALDFMDLLAVKECTDQCFLPERFAKLTPEQVDKRIGELC
ncbi:MAG: ATP-binding protein [Fibrobacterota bacterium]|nr:AAA family ATPase [Chitinispirillaceae bacterium]